MLFLISLGFLTVGGRQTAFALIFSYNGFNQLNEKYGDNTAQIIMDNCYVWNYLKTSNEVTAEKISKKFDSINKVEVGMIEDKEE